MPQRYDVGTLAEPQRTPQGGIRAPAHLTRVGVFKYTRDDGSVIREYRPPDEVFHVDSLATLPGAPLTKGHPRKLVTPDNFGAHAVGHVADNVQADGETIAADVVIQERRAIRAVLDDGVRQMSCGYNCELDETPGVSPTGEAYDCVQRAIRYNHVALVPVGRAGPEVSLRLDSAGDQLAEDDQPRRQDEVHQESDMANTPEFEVIDDIRYEVGTDPHKHAVKRRIEEAQNLKARHDAAELNLEREKQTAQALKGRADAAEKQLADAEARIAELERPERLDAAVNARLELVSRARVVLGKESRFDGMTTRQIHATVAQKLLPDVKLDEATDVYLQGLFDAFTSGPAAKAVERAKANAPKAAAMDSARADAQAPEDTVSAARRRWLEENREAWKKPLAITRKGA